MLELGRKPERLRLLLVAGDSFRCEIELDETTEFLTPPVLKFSDGTLWTAELPGARLASFDVSPPEVLDVLDLPNREVLLILDGVIFATGPFEVN